MRAQIKTISPTGYEVTFDFGDDALDATQLARALAKIENELARADYLPTGELPKTPEGDPVCIKHRSPMREREKQGDTWYSHSIVDQQTGERVYCKGRPGTDSPGWNISTGTPTPAASPTPVGGTSSPTPTTARGNGRVGGPTEKTQPQRPAVTPAKQQPPTPPTPNVTAWPREAIIAMASVAKIGDAARAMELLTQSHTITPASRPGVFGAWAAALARAMRDGQDDAQAVFLADAALSSEVRQKA